MIAYLKLIKIDNLILIALAQLAIKYGLFEPFDISITLNGLGITLLVLASICIAAAGNIMLEMHTTSTNSLLQQYQISEKTAERFFIGFSVIGVALGFYMANLINRPGFAALFIITSGIYYLYATYLKEILIVKNLIIGLLMVLAILVVAIFDLLPAITPQNQASQSVFFSILLDYAFLGFVIVVIREIIKDILSMDADHNAQLKTIPLLLGRERAAKLCGILAIIPIAALVYYIYTYLFNNTNAVLFALVLLIGPLLIFLIKSWTASSTKDFNILSLLLKIVLITTAVSLMAYQFVLS